MFTDMPYICEGQILEVIEPLNGVGQTMYRCLVEMRNGQYVVLPHVLASSMFGGVADYMQIRSRSAKDSGEDFELSSNNSENNSSIGDRVYIAFISGNIKKPIIMGYAQHPNQTQEFASQKDLDPQAVFQYNGVRIKIDDKGQVTIARQGSPTISPVPADGGGPPAVTAAFRAALAAANAVVSSSGLVNPVLPPINPAVEMPDKTEVTLLEMLEGGVFRIRDADGQVIEIDRTKKRIHISNNDLKSTDGKVAAGLLAVQAASPILLSESITLDGDGKAVKIRARGLIDINSAGDRKDTTLGDHSHTITGNSETKAIGDVTETVGGAWTVESVLGVTLTGGKAVLKLGKGQIGLGGPAGELIDLIIQTLEAVGEILTANQAQTHMGNLGYPTSPPINTADYAKTQLKVKKIQSILNLLKGGI